MQNNFDFSCLKIDLLEKISSLKTTTDYAIENLSITYGKNHPMILRLRSYYMGIDNCLTDINSLDAFFEQKNYDAIELVTVRIKAISEMIKNDAKDLLLSIQTGFDDVPDEFLWN